MIVQLQITFFEYVQTSVTGSLLRKLLDVLRGKKLARMEPRKMKAPCKLTIGKIKSIYEIKRKENRYTNEKCSVVLSIRNLTHD